MKEKTISIRWSTLDIEQQSEKMGVREKLTDQDIYDVLSLMEHEHDATIGINWEIIECCIDQILSEKISMV